MVADQEQQLIAAYRPTGHHGYQGSYFGIARDNVESLVDRLRVAMDSCDVVLLTGGVSMGDYDHVPEALERLKVKIMFHSIAIQPGRPTVFGMAEHKYIFGLPGNPVSSYVIFEILVKPMLYKLMGHDHKPVQFRLPMGSIIRGSGRPEVIYPGEYQGRKGSSGNLSWFGPYSFLCICRWNHRHGGGNNTVK